MKNLSGQGYKTVIIPSVTAISKKAMDRLQAFAKAGGCVVFLGEGPSLVVDKTFLKAGQPVDLSWAISLLFDLLRLDGIMVSSRTQGMNLQPGKKIP